MLNEKNGQKHKKICINRTRSENTDKIIRDVVKSSKNSKPVLNFLELQNNSVLNCGHKTANMNVKAAF